MEARKESTALCFDDGEESLEIGTIGFRGVPAWTISAESLSMDASDGYRPVLVRTTNPNR